MNTRVSLLALSLAAAAPALGTISSFTGAVSYHATPPAASKWGTWSNGATVHAWTERTNITVTGLAAQMITNPSNSAFPTAGAYSGVVDSHMIHHESYWIYYGTITGTITFNDPIVAVIYDWWSLKASDSVCGAPGTAYSPQYNFRGFAPGTCLISINNKTLTFTLPVSNQPLADYDEIRVLTAPIPTPGAAALACIGGLIALRRRR